jgi:hypothetical protein
VGVQTESGALMWKLLMDRGDDKRTNNNPETASLTNTAMQEMKSGIIIVSPVIRHRYWVAELLGAGGTAA